MPRKGSPTVKVKVSPTQQLWTETRRLRAANAWKTIGIMLIISVGVAALVLALLFMFSLPAHPTCVDPKLGDLSNNKLQVRVLGSKKNPDAVNKCLTVVPIASKVDGAVTAAELTLEPCRTDNSDQYWTVSEMTVTGSVPNGTGKPLTCAEEGAKTALYSLTNVNGLRQVGSTSPWRLVTPCAMRSLDFSCRTSGSGCVAQLSNNNNFAQFTACLNENGTSMAAMGNCVPSSRNGSDIVTDNCTVSSKSTALASQGVSTSAAPVKGTAAAPSVAVSVSKSISKPPSVPPPPKANNLPIHKPPFALATQSSAEPFFLFNRRTADNWCGFEVRDVNANSIEGFDGLGYDSKLNRVVWGDADLVLGFVAATPAQS